MHLKETYCQFIKVLFLTGVLVLLNVHLYSQEPSFSRIGEEELADMDIYSITQDKQGYIWISTDRDLIKYDGYSFRHISNNTTGTKPLFGLTKDNFDNIFCFSLGGEIFTIRNDSLLLYFTIPDSLLNVEQNIFFDEQNNLNVCGKHLFKITPLKKIDIILNSQGKPATAHAGIKTADGRYLIGKSYGHSVEYIINGKLIEYVVNDNHNNGLVPFSSSKQTYLHTPNEFKAYIQQKNNFKRIPLEINSIPQNTLPSRVFATNNGFLWFTARTGGIYAFNSFGAALYNGNKIFSNFFISGFLEDREGNYWFTTLGKGILYVANPSVISFQNHSILKNEVINLITSNNEDKLFIGCESGNIIQLTSGGDIEYLVTGIGKKVNILEFINEQNVLVYEDKDGLIFIDPINKKVKREINNTGTVKDINYVGHDNYIIGSSNRVLKNDAIHPKINFNRRISHLYFHPLDSTIWIIGPTGLYKVSKDGSTKKLNSYGTFPVDINGIDNQIWIATAEHGAFCIENGQIKKHLTTSNGLLSKQIKKMFVQEGLVFIVHDLGLQYYNIKTGVTKNLNTTHGIHSNYIIDLEYKNGTLSIVTQKGLQQFLLSSISNNSVPPLINITSIKIENEVYGPSNFVHSGKYNQPIELFFSAGAYQHSGKLLYVYRLKGRSDDWDTISYNQNHIRYESLGPGRYMFEIKAVNENNISSVITRFEYVVIPPVWQRWWFYILIIIVAIVIVLLIYKWQLNRIERKNQQKNELISSRLTALKSQMNPHFIFNALNSIQDLVLQQETEKSYDYIVKFSNLVRQTLNYSDKDFIDFDDELKLLNVYLELEQLRFQDKFTYSIKKINIEEIKVPPMLVQPFVENAIKHGLLHKNGDKELSIVFEQTDVLTCTITDNGIGRNKAREIKERQNKAHESFSVQAIKSRFEIMQDLYKSTLGVEYEDLYEQGIATGTRVTLRLPFKPQY